jgi:hypothetical protein
MFISVLIHDCENWTVRTGKIREEEHKRYLRRNVFELSLDEGRHEQIRGKLVVPNIHETDCKGF